MKHANHTTVSIAPKTFAWALFFVLIAIGMYYMRGILLIILTSVVIASFIEAPVRWLMKIKIPRAISVLITYVVSAGLIGLFLSFIIPVFISEVSTLFLLFPESTSIDLLQRFSPENMKSMLGLASETQQDPLALIDSLQTEFGGATKEIFENLTLVFGGVFNGILIFVLSFFLAVEEKGIEKFLRLVLPSSHEKYAVDLWNRSQRKIEIWFSGQLLAALFVGIMVYVGLIIFGVPYAFLLALLAFLFELVPFGSILAGIPAALIGFLAGGMPLAIYIVVLYIIVQQLEGHVIYPLVMKRVIGMPPLIVILSLVVGATLGGFLGVIIAMPVTVGLLEFVSDIEKGKLSSETS
ncbi:MAG: AI-2E family transporter [Candidatus Pacebacteria bacterium]|nr:AI-2E family transporter [Candidatus Paceibacterota bacterium]